ncbi:aspartate dehydrogenase domain-containing protein [Hyla sarda]|uniref:aspartate dehydrogenase domain-containing protein n=1 Tax=Hyla sarda TaxID=327740 RepID=UPI0024C421DE|nr:aspartate dehydrogenase domain-containing protein [Hyla sarda]
MSNERKRRIGIVGYGHVGVYLVNQIQREGDKNNVEIAFVWNRTMEKMEKTIESHLQLRNLDDFEKREADLIVEVAHPSITRKYGERFLSAANLLTLVTITCIITLLAITCHTQSPGFAHPKKTSIANQNSPSQSANYVVALSTFLFHGEQHLGQDDPRD